MAVRLDGRQISAEIRQELAHKVTITRESHPDFSPGLAIVQVGNREDSNVYIRMKLRGAKEIGMNAEHIKLSRCVFFILGLVVSLYIYEEKVGFIRLFAQIDLFLHVYLIRGLIFLQ